ncbi:hypothetical protein HU200_000046 [Digitaria exilis]|uniref:Uncharacterized protein n=1 Tax=Digitaria exilis TaxID=1010633 RepID=A0A835G394_9POAL|nr:hypothetical protein HU200_000046 [Digitaria exilis]
MGSAAGKVVRAALHAFFRQYHPWSSSATLLALPFSAAALLSRSHPALLAPARALSRRLRRAFVAAGFPPASQLLFLLSHRLSHRACAFLASLPFSLSFLLLAKAFAVHSCSPPPPPPLRRHRRKQPSSIAAVAELVRSSYPAMAATQLVNCLALVLANAAVFAALLAAFNAADALHLLGGGAAVPPSDSISVPNSGGGGRAVLALSAAGVIVYSVALANASAVCNLATVVAAAEGRGGAHAMLKAVLMLLRAGDAATAVAASLPASLAAAAVEALFHLRVMRPYTLTGGKVTAGMLCEGILVAYVHAMICVLDTVVTTMVYQTCKASHSCHLVELELELDEGKEDLRV